VVSGVEFDIIHATKRKRDKRNSSSEEWKDQSATSDSNPFAEVTKKVSNLMYEMVSDSSNFRKRFQYSQNKNNKIQNTEQ
jgi:hypothetical protein